MFNVKCPKCGAYRSARQINWKQLWKRTGIMCIFIAISFILAFTVNILFALITAILIIFTPFYAVAIGSKDKFIRYKCNLCKHEFKVKNFRNKEVRSLNN